MQVLREQNDMDGDSKFQGTSLHMRIALGLGGILIVQYHIVT